MPVYTLLIPPIILKNNFHKFTERSATLNNTTSGVNFSLYTS